ncbi:hypothetical protein TMatcc_008307 [Talaromyces marneffei ATCC 18224]
MLHLPTTNTHSTAHYSPPNQQAAWAGLRRVLSSKFSLCSHSVSHGTSSVTTAKVKWVVYLISGPHTEFFAHLERWNLCEGGGTAIMSWTHGT